MTCRSTTAWLPRRLPAPPVLPRLLPASDCRSVRILRRGRIHRGNNDAILPYSRRDTPSRAPAELSASREPCGAVHPHARKVFRRNVSLWFYTCELGLGLPMSKVRAVPAEGTC